LSVVKGNQRFFLNAHPNGNFGRTCINGGIMIDGQMPELELGSEKYIISPCARQCHIQHD